MEISSTIMSLLLNCQWFECFCDIINKYNDVIDFIVFLFLIAFAFYMAKKKTTGIKPCILVCTNFLALIFSIAALCMTHPNQLGFDYIGVIVGILALLVTILIGWNIYQLVDVKGIRKEFEAYKEDVKADINRHLLLEENALAVEYWRERDWNKVLIIRSNMAHRLRQLLENDSDTVISDFVSSVAQMINHDLKENDYIQHGSQLAGFMDVFRQLSKYNKRINDIYDKYKENASKFRASVLMRGISNDREKKSIKYVVAICQFTNFEYLAMKDADSLSKAKYPFKMGSIKDAHLFDSEEQALDEYRQYTDIKGARPIIVSVIIDEDEKKEE